MSREQLPNRRASVTRKVEHKGQTLFVTVGFDNEGRVKEVFGNSSKMTSDMDFLVSDACIVLSLALQYTIHPFELKHSLKTVPAFHAEEGDDGQFTAVERDVPASLIGLLVDVLIEEQQAAAGA